VPIGDDGVWERVLAVLSDKRRVDDVPLRLQDPSEDDMACFVRDSFEVVQGGDGLQGSDVWGGQIEGGKFGHLVRGRLVDLADQHANMAHGRLLRQSVAHILPRLCSICI
jgi:hypothetical protein